MSLTINTNLTSLMTQLSLKNATFDMNRAIEQMTTGFKINSAKDDAAGYSVAKKMEIDLSSYDVVKNNTMLGQSLINTATSSLDIVTTHLQRIRDLAEQAANGTYGNDSIQAIQTEINQRTAEINRVMATTEYNGIKLFEGTGASPIATIADDTQYVTGDFINSVTQLSEAEATAQGYTIITDRAGLEAINSNLSGKYILMNDIDLLGSSWSPISGFTGELNGNGYVIKNLTSSVGGLFDTIEYMVKISNLGLENVNINSSNNYIGALVGTSNAATITNCYSTGNIVGNASVGGFIGTMEYGGTIDSCYSNANVTATNITSVYVNSDGAGGFASRLRYGTVTNSYATGNVQGAEAGGFVSFIDSMNTISNNYSTGNVICTDTTNAYYGGYIGNSNGYTVADCYYDSTTSGCTDTNGGSQGVSTTQLNTLIANGTLPKATPAPTPPPTPAGAGNITLQVGIDSSTNSQISFNTALSISLSVNVSSTTNARNSLADIDAVLAQVTQRQTEFGAVQNRLDSVIESLEVSIANTTSSLSTIKDADIAKVSSEYIRAQILQQASSTLLSTANQAPSVALNLI